MKHLKLAILLAAIVAAAFTADRLVSPRPDSSPATEPATTEPAATQPPAVQISVPPGSPYIAPVGRSPIPQPGEQLKRPFPYRPAKPPKAPIIPPPAQDQPVNWQQAGRYIGQTITVRGRIVHTHNTGEVCFLNFSQNWQGQFYLIVFADQFDQWPKPPQDYFLGQTVLVTGQVQQHRGRPQIRITDPAQVTVVEPHHEH